MLTVVALAGLPAAVATAAGGRLSPSSQMPLPTRERARVALAVDAGGRPWLAAGATLWRLRLGERRWEPHAAPVPAPAELLGLPDGRLAVASAEPSAGLVLWIRGRALPLRSPGLPRRCERCVSRPTARSGRCTARRSRSCTSTR